MELKTKNCNYSRWTNSSQRCVQWKFSDWYSHPLTTKITEPKNTLTISNNNHFNVSHWPVSQHLKNLPSENIHSITQYWKIQLRMERKWKGNRTCLLKRYKVLVDAGKCFQISGKLHRLLECKQPGVVPPHDQLEACKIIVHFSPATYTYESM